MKAKFILFLLAFTGIILTACDDDDKDPENNLVEDAFYEMYPYATDVDWDRDGVYYVVNFNNRDWKTKAWFLGNGTWYQTRVEIEDTDNLPPLVRTAFYDSVYNSYDIRKMYEYYNNSDERWYYFELESDTDLRIDEDGTIRVV